MSSTCFRSVYPMCFDRRSLRLPLTFSGFMKQGHPHTMIMHCHATCRPSCLQEENGLAVVLSFCHFERAVCMPLQSFFLCAEMNTRWNCKPYPLNLICWRAHVHITLFCDCKSSSLNPDQWRIHVYRSALYDCDRYNINSTQRSMPSDSDRAEASTLIRGVCLCTGLHSETGCGSGAEEGSLHRYISIGARP